MIDIKELRRLAEHHDGVTSSAPIKPAALLEILDRLEAAEKERDKLKELNSALCTKSNSQVIHNARLAEENDALRAKVEQMERQEPAGKFIQHPSNGLWEQDGYGDNPDARPLYALPGAQPEPSEQDESVRKAWSRFSNELHRSPDAPYPGMSEAFEQHFSQSFTDRDWRVESGVWAAAWKAAKRHGAQPAPSVPDGWKLVPIEPTEKMINEGTCASTLPGPRYIDSACAKQCWTNMLAAAPEAKP